MPKRPSDEVFGAPSLRGSGATPRSRGRTSRAAQLSDDGNKPKSVLVMLRPSQVAFLDHLAANIQEQTGLSVKRAELIRGMIDALEAMGLGPVLTKHARVASRINDVWVKETLRQVLSLGAERSA